MANYISDDSHLLYFYGTECTHCHEMDPLHQQLHEETGAQIRKIEVWHNMENAKMLMELDAGRCGGVPFYYNEKTKDFICGNCDYDKLKAWATKE